MNKPLKAASGAMISAINVADRPDDNFAVLS